MSIARDIEEGWKVVTRRRRVSTTKRRSTAQKPSNFPNKQHAVLLKQGRCFKCLQRGHKKSSCNAPRRCFNCQSSQHISRHCKASFGRKKFNEEDQRLHSHVLNNSKEDKHSRDSIKGSKTAPPSYTTLPHNIHKHFQMEVPNNWQHVQMRDPDFVNNDRIHELRVFLQPRDALHHVNRFLDRSAIIFTGPHYNESHLAPRLATALARHFDRYESDFTISRLSPDHGDFIVVFPTVHMRNLAVEEGVFHLGNNTEVQLIEWADEMGMAYDPTTHIARLRLTGVPLQNWNRSDLTSIVSGFGYLLRVAPFFVNGNYDTLQVLVACRDLLSIPRGIMLTDEPHATMIQVELQGWMQGEGGRLPPPPPPPDDFRNLHRRAISPEVLRYHNRNRRQGQGGSNQGRAPNQQQPRRRMNPELEGTVLNPTGEMQPMALSVVNNSRPKNQEVFQPLSMNIYLTNGILNGAFHEESGKFEPLRVINANTPIWNQGIFGPISLQPSMFCFSAKLDPLSIIQKGPVLNISEAFNHFNLEAGNNKNFNFEAISGPKISEVFDEEPNQLVLSDKEIEGPPPGFEGSPKYGGKVRRSPRLQAKNTGPYTTMMQKARKVRGYIDNVVQTTPKRKKIKNAKQPEMEYLKNFDPLKEVHAEVLVSVAGITMNEEMMNKMKNILGKGEEQGGPALAGV